MSHGSHSVVIGLRDLTNYETTGRSKIISASRLVAMTASVYTKKNPGPTSLGRIQTFPKKIRNEFYDNPHQNLITDHKTALKQWSQQKSHQSCFATPCFFLWGMNTSINRRWIPDREKASGLEAQTELCQWLKNNWSTIFPLNIETANCQRQAMREWAC